MNPNRSSLIGFFFITAVILLSVYGQLILKWRLNHLLPISSGTRHPLLQLLWLLLDPIILSGLVAAFFASIAWLGVLKRFDFSFAYPFMSLNFAIAILASAWLLNEAISMQRLMGVALIIVGTIVAARG
jgi:uncharacterized membrane protein